MFEGSGVEPTVVDGRREVAAWAATTLLLFMVTKGPVFRVRIEAAPLAGDFIDDRWVQATFLAGALLVIGMCLPAVEALRSDRLVLASQGAFVGSVVLSSVWSVDPMRSLEQAVMLATGTGAALLAGAYVGRTGSTGGTDESRLIHGRRGIVVALAVACHAGVAISVIAFARDWQFAIDWNDDLAGIYFNRNSLGPVAVTAAATAVVLAASVRAQRPIAALALGVLATADLWVWWRSGSLTPVFGFAVAAVVVGVVALAVPGPRAHGRRLAAGVAGTLLAVGVIAAVILRGTIASRLDRSPTLSGRTEIWDVVLQFVDDRPFHGWGFLAVWTRSEIVEALDEQYGREVYEAHSGYLEVLLGVGVVGLVAMLAVVGVALHRTGRATWRSPDIVTMFLFGTVVYAAAVNLGETYAGANLLPWTMLAVATGAAVSERASDQSCRVSASVTTRGS